MAPRTYEDLQWDYWMDKTRMGQQVIHLPHPYDKTTVYIIKYSTHEIFQIKVLYSNEPCILCHVKML